MTSFGKKKKIENTTTIIINDNMNSIYYILYNKISCFISISIIIVIYIIVVVYWVEIHVGRKIALVIFDIKGHFKCPGATLARLVFAN